MSGNEPYANIYEPNNTVSAIIDMNNMTIPGGQKSSISCSNYSIRNQNSLGGDHSKCIKGNEDPWPQFFKRWDFKLGPFLGVTTREVSGQAVTHKSKT